MRVLVTGAAGFIGFHLARRLLAEGWQVDGIDAMTPYYDVRLKQSRWAQLEASPSFRGQVGRLEDREALFAFAEANPPEVIVHLAAQAGVRYSIENPRAYFDSNLEGTYHILELARALKPRHLMAASTSSVYGANTVMPFRETDRTDHPLTLYAATKKADEDMAHSYAHLWSLPTTVFRFFTVYGPWGRPDMALFKFLDAAIRDEPIEVYGHGKMQRDFTYVDDLVEALVRLIDTPPRQGEPVGEHDSLSPAAPYRVVNIGGGRPTGLMDYVAAIERALGRPIARRMLEMQQGDVPATWASPDLLQALTGYTPDTDVETGVQRFVEWWREYRGL